MVSLLFTVKLKLISSNASRYNVSALEEILLFHLGLSREKNDLREQNPVPHDNYFQSIISLCQCCEDYLHPRSHDSTVSIPQRLDTILSYSSHHRWRHFL